MTKLAIPDYEPPPPVADEEGVQALRELGKRTARAERKRPEPSAHEGNEVLARVAEEASRKREARGEKTSSRVNIDLSLEEHKNLADRARNLGLTQREIIRIAIAPLLRKP